MPDTADVGRLGFTLGNYPSTKISCCILYQKRPGTNTKPLSSIHTPLYACLLLLAASVRVLVLESLELVQEPLTTLTPERSEGSEGLPEGPLEPPIPSTPIINSLH